MSFPCPKCQVQLALSIYNCVFPFRIHIALKIFLKDDDELKPTIVHYGSVEKITLNLLKHFSLVICDLRCSLDVWQSGETAVP